MADKSIGTLSVYLNGNKSGLDRTLKSASKGIGEFKNYAMQAAGAIGLAFSFTAAIQGISKLKNEMDQIGKASTNLGVSTGFFQELEYAAQRTGTSIEMVQSGFIRIKKLAGDAAAGKKSALETLQNLGLDANSVRNMSSEELFNSVNSALDSLDEKMRSSVGAEIYGKQFEKMNNFLRDYISLGQEAKDRGIIIDDEEIKSAEALNDAILNLERSIRSLTANSGLVSWLTNIAEGLDELINRTSEKKAKKEDIDVEDSGSWYKSLARYGLNVVGVSYTLGSLLSDRTKFLGEELLGRGVDEYSFSSKPLSSPREQKRKDAAEKIKENGLIALAVAREADEEIAAKLKAAENTEDVFSAQEIAGAAEAVAQKAKARISALQMATDKLRKDNRIFGSRKEFADANDLVNGFTGKIKEANQKSSSEIEKKLKKIEEESSDASKQESKWRETEEKRQKALNQDQIKAARDIRYRYLEMAGDSTKAEMEKYINELNDRYMSQYGRGLTDKEKDSFMAQKKQLIDLDRSSESLRTLFNGNALAESLQKGSLEVYRLQAKMKDPAREEQLKLARENADAAKRAAAAAELMAQKTVGIQAANIGSVIGV